MLTTEQQFLKLLIFAPLRHFVPTFIQCKIRQTLHVLKKLPLYHGVLQNCYIVDFIEKKLNKHLLTERLLICV